MTYLKHTYLLKTVSVLLALSLFLNLSTPVYATGNVDSLEQSTSNLENELSGLQSELAALGAEISSISDQITTISEEIKQTKEELAIAKGNEEAQYETMKSRIKYMYENGNSNLLEVLLSSSCMADFLNRAEFFSTISKYDQAQLEKLVETQEAIAQKEAKLAEEQANLLSLQAELNEKETIINSQISDTSEELSNFKAQLAAAKAKAQKAQEELNQKVEPVAPSKPETPADSNTGSNSNTNSDSNVGSSSNTDSDSNAGSNSNTSSDSSGSEESFDYIAASSEIELFAALIECEAGSTDYEGMLAVASVVMNRVKHRYYPDTIRGVILQAGQFTPVQNGKVDRVLKRGVKSACVAAANDAIAGKNNVGDCLNFRSSDSGHDGTLIGGNVFF